MNTIIDFDAIERLAVNSTPYPYFGLANALNSSHKKSLIADFPSISRGGSFPLSGANAHGLLKRLIDEINSDKFRDLIAKKFEVDLSDRPIVITARGQSRKHDGQIHTDSKTKLITILIYLNNEWDSPTGRLRILNSQHIDDLKEEFSSAYGQMIAFKVTDNCWHGYLPYEGMRQSLQVNYLVDNKYNKYHIYRHKISAFFKKHFTS